MNPREAIEAAELAGHETAYRNRLGRQMYEAGRRDGYEAGRRDAEADMAHFWAEAARQVTRGVSNAELEQRRWGPGGRAHFADPRPGDFRGRENNPEPQPEAELEAEAR